MNIDEKIHRELNEESQQLDELLMQEEQGYFTSLLSVFKGKLRVIAILGNIFTLILTALWMWSAWEFFHSTQTDQMVYWGVCFIVTINAQAMLKMWMFMQADKYSVMREIKRQELAINRLEQSLSQQ